MEFNATIFVSGFSFIVFVFIMDTILYKPIQKIIGERNRYIESNLDEANNINEKAKAIIDDKNEQLKKAHKSAKEVISSGVEQSKAVVSQKVSDVVNTSREKIDAEKARLLSEEVAAKEVLKSNVTDLSKSIAEKLMGQNIDAFEYNQDVVEEALGNV